jgi:hypothetical protein
MSKVSNTPIPRSTELQLRALQCGPNGELGDGISTKGAECTSSRCGVEGHANRDMRALAGTRASRLNEQPGHEAGDAGDNLKAEY